MIAKYYSRVNVDRVSQLIGISAKVCEEKISEMVNRGTIMCKIDRFNRIVEFKKNDVHNKNGNFLNAWSDNIKEAMKLTNKTAYIVQKELSVNFLID